MVRILHLADLHLGAKPAFLGDKAGSRSSTILNAFSRAVAFAADPVKGIDAVVIAGDFFDGPNPPSEVVRFAIEQLSRLHQSEIPVILVPGNHDAIAFPNGIYEQKHADFSALTHFITSPQVELAASISRDNRPTLHFYGMAWDAAHSRPPFDEFYRQDKPGLHIAVIHGTLNTCRFSDGYSREVPLDLARLSESGMDYIALGHIHGFQQHIAGSVPVVYPGTLEARRFSPAEEGERSLVIANIPEGRESPASIETIPWNTHTLESAALDLDQELVESQSQLVDLIRKKYSDPQKLLRLTLTGSPSFIIDAESLSDSLAGDFFWLQVDDRTEFFSNTMIAGWAQEKTIRGMFVRKMQQMLSLAKDDAEREKVELALKAAVQAFQNSGRS